MSTGARHSSQNLLKTIPNQTPPSQPACTNWGGQGGQGGKTSKNDESEHVKRSGYTTNNNLKLRWMHLILASIWGQAVTNRLLFGRLTSKKLLCSRHMQKLVLYWIYEITDNKAEERPYFALSLFLRWWTGKKKRKKKCATCLLVGIALFARHLSGIILN